MNGTRTESSDGLQPQWRLIDEFGPEIRHLLSGKITELLETHPDACLDHDPSWLQSKALSNGGQVKIYVYVDADHRLSGYAPFLVHPSLFSFSYGGFTLYEHAIRRYSLTSQPLLLDGQCGAEEMVTTLLTRVHKGLAGRTVAFGLGIPIDSPFGRSLALPPVLRLFHVMPHGPQYQRRLLRLPNSLDEYMSQLGPKTRQDLRRQERRLLKETGDDVRVSVHRDADSVVAFLDIVETISQRTYQWNQLHIGIHNSEPTRQHFEKIARNGWLRGYVLHARGTPIAFMIGYLYRSVYYSESIGYDPQWAEWSVGNILHLHVVRDLTAKPTITQWFDFMYGDNSNKERLSSDSRKEGNYYLVPRTFAWAFFVWALRGFDRTTSAANAVLDSVGAKTRVRRFLRRRG